MANSLRAPLLTLLLIASCAMREPAGDYPRTPSYAIAASSPTSLQKAIAHGMKTHKDESGFHLLASGTEAFLTRIAIVESAERSIDLQYFSTRDDTTGQLLLEALLRAADRGVRVRMLLDDWNLDDFKARASALNAHPNIEIRVFNPYATNDESIFTRIGTVFTRMGQFTRRMHNKALIVDNQFSIVGGRNLGDEYFDAGSDFNFRDLDVLAAGPITAKLSKSFDSYWNSQESYPVDALNLPKADPEDIKRLRDQLQRHWQEEVASPNGKPLAAPQLVQHIESGELPLIWAKADIAADSPLKIDKPVATSSPANSPIMQLDKLSDGAQHEFIIISPYFVPLDGGVDWLGGLVKRGVRVRVLTNSLASTDVVPVHSGYSHYRPELLKSGVELYELKSVRAERVHHPMFSGSSQSSLHAKIYVIDRRDLAIGSFNLDPRSVWFNTELVLVIHSPELAAKAAAIFERASSPDSSFRLKFAPDGHLEWITEEKGEEKTYDSEPPAGFRRSITNDFFTLLPIDNKL